MIIVEHSIFSLIVYMGNLTLHKILFIHLMSLPSHNNWQVDENMFKIVFQELKRE